LVYHPASTLPEAASQHRKGSAVDPQLDGKAALVAGASQGIGRPVAEHLAAGGANLAITATGRPVLLLAVT
jgi:5,10-methylene-tetrahydrofolate dehydrogenase/methenyl tetrahydrofolate cyclohydrolase